ncbi:hypothetical protein FE236_07650 [Mariprofundus erugo]|uniref:hypothetical protein n=1 Tax=Mariprofundus erugo TaxID=2528639 RepID=UPI0010FE1DA7|nr:hypothetical protein [Mariprofundus erugo]TLS76002.1 hypothetical protein FE236_07650 [Mariprofundus erugo]
MSVPTVDIKILWARAAGRCSMPDCRRELTPESDTVAAGGIVVGENCHIVAEKVNGPRGRYPVPEADKNRYPNLILLCNIHHKIVDSDVTSWSVERLHQVKSDHENWIKTTFDQSRNSDLVVYKRLVEIASKKLMLQAWDGISDHAVRHLAYIQWIEGIYEFNAAVQHALLPGNQIAFEDSIRMLSSRACKYADHYMSLAWSPREDGSFYQEDKTWKKVWREDCAQFADRSEAWRSNNFALLMNLTHAINEFSDCVRAFVDPFFFLERGRFSICDSMGVTNMLNPCWILPSGYLDVRV